MTVAAREMLSLFEKYLCCLKRARLLLSLLFLWCGGRAGRWVGGVGGEGGVQISLSECIFGYLSINLLVFV